MYNADKHKTCQWFIDTARECKLWFCTTEYLKSFVWEDGRLVSQSAEYRLALAELQDLAIASGCLF